MPRAYEIVRDFLAKIPSIGPDNDAQFDLEENQVWCLLCRTPTEMVEPMYYLPPMEGAMMRIAGGRSATPADLARDLRIAKFGVEFTRYYILPQYVPPDPADFLNMLASIQTLHITAEEGNDWFHELSWRIIFLEGMIRKGMRLLKQQDRLLAKLQETDAWLKMKFHPRPASPSAATQRGEIVVKAFAVVISTFNAEVMGQRQAIGTNLNAQLAAWEERANHGSDIMVAGAAVWPTKQDIVFLQTIPRILDLQEVVNGPIVQHLDALRAKIKARIPGADWRWAGRLRLVALLLDDAYLKLAERLRGYQEMALAFASASHPALGAESSAAVLHEDVFQRIMSFF